MRGIGHVGNFFLQNGSGKMVGGAASVKQYSGQKLNLRSGMLDTKLLPNQDELS